MASFTNIVVGTDGSESSFLAVERAASLAKDAGATLHLVSAFPPVAQRDRDLAADEMGAMAYRSDGAEVMDEALKQASARAAGAGATNVELYPMPGDPVPVLLAAAVANKADLIVVGNRGLNTLSGRILGSVPLDIAHKASCDVLIVHTTD